MAHRRYQNAVATLACSAVAALSAGCSESDEGCRERDEAVGVGEASDLGFSAEEVIEGSEEHGADLTWSDPPSWLPFSQVGETRVSTAIALSDRTARVQRNRDTDCRLTLVAEVRLDLATEDRAFDVSVDAAVQARDEESFEVVAALDARNGGDALGEFELPRGVQLSFSQTIHADGDVEGLLFAWTTEVGTHSTSLKSASIASWSGSVGAIDLMPQVETSDAGSPEDASTDDSGEVDDDSLVFDEDIGGVAQDASLDTNR